jgi:hypothetical protein
LAASASDYRVKQFSYYLVGGLWQWVDGAIDMARTASLQAALQSAVSSPDPHEDAVWQPSVCLPDGVNRQLEQVSHSIFRKRRRPHCLLPQVFSCQSRTLGPESIC